MPVPPRVEDEAGRDDEHAPAPQRGHQQPAQRQHEQEEDREGGCREEHAAVSLDSGAMVRVRFAPSPTGTLHLGSALSAAANRTFADEHDGTMLLRIDDTDPTRVVEGGEEAILGDLEWLGIGWDEGPVRQSDRGGRHREAAAQVAGAAEDDEGALRFGKTTLLRADGSPTYQLASVVDDLDFGITHVIRGSDHRDNAPLQAELFRGPRRRAARVHPPRAAARARRAQALEAPRRDLCRRPARRGHPGRGGARLPRRARPAAPRRPPRPRASAAARGRDDRGDERRVACRAGRRPGRARAGAARCARPRRGAGVGAARSSRPSRHRCPRARP